MGRRARGLAGGLWVRKGEHERVADGIACVDPVRPAPDPRRLDDSDHHQKPREGRTLGGRRLGAANASPDTVTEGQTDPEAEAEADTGTPAGAPAATDDELMTDNAALGKTVVRTGQPMKAAIPADLHGWFESQGSVRVSNEATSFEVILSDQLPAHAGKKALLKLYAQPSRDREVVLANIGTLDHAHVPRILEHGSAGQYQYELLEWVEGETLTDFVGRSTTQRLAEDTVAAVVREIAQALQAMHSHSPPLTHGDIKPDNIIVRTEMPLDLVVTDFGVAKFTDGNFTTVGTREWASPQALKSVVEPAGDWWSLGIIAYWCLTGRLPHDSSPSLEDYVLAVESQGVDFTPLRTAAQGMSWDWIRLCQGLLACSSAERWGWNEVESWLAGDAPKAPASWRGVAGGPGHFKRFDETVTDLQQARLLLGTNWPTAVKDVANTTVREQLFIDLLTVCPPATKGELASALAGTVDQDPEVTLVNIGCALAPHESQYFRGWLLDTSGIEALASTGAQQPASAEAGTILALDDKNLFARVDPVNGAAIAAGLADARARFERVVTQGGHELDGSTRSRARCRLVAALANPEVARQLATQAADLATTEARAQPWFRQAADDAADNLGEAVAVIVLASFASQQTRDHRRVLHAQRTEALRQRRQSSLDRMPRSRAMLGIVLIFVQLPLAVVALARLTVLPNLADYFSLTPAGMADFLSFLDSPVGVWLSYASQPWAILPVTAASLLLLIRSARTSTATSVPRPPIERRLMQVLIVLTTLLAPLIAPLVAWGFVHGLTRYAAHKYRSPLRSWGFFLSTSSLLFSLLLALQIPPSTLTDAAGISYGLPTTGWFVGVAENIPLNNLFLAPVRVAESFDTYYPIAPDWILFTLLIAAGNLVLWLLCRRNLYHPDSQATVTWIKMTLVFGIVGVACLVAAYLQVGHHWWLNLALLVAVALTYLALRARSRR